MAKRLRLRTAAEIQAALDEVSSSSDSELDLSEGSTVTSSSEDDSDTGDEQPDTSDDGGIQQAQATWRPADVYQPLIHPLDGNDGVKIDFYNFNMQF